VAPRIVLHFHPGWGYQDGTVLNAIATSGWYRSQWQTGTSNGGLTAHRGGDRWRWESDMFGERYDDAPARDRPVYGAWTTRPRRVGNHYTPLVAELVNPRVHGRMPKWSDVQRSRQGAPP
jgi:hypothetical protein